MITKKITLLLLTCIVFISCAEKDDSESEASSGTNAYTPAPIAPAVPAPTITETLKPPVPAGLMQAGINPAHGEPGHRCDIAVGAPLNGGPTVANTPNQTIPIPAPPTPTITPQKFAAGMNPSHGEPGHRCDIAVGAPLNSKPVATNTNAPEQIKPITSTPTVTPQKVAFGMNPAHGEAGHRCDIAVGAPLSSKPPQTTTPTIVPSLAVDSSKN